MIDFLLLAQQTNLEMQKFRFEQQPGQIAGQSMAFIGLGVIIVIVSVVAFIFLRRKRTMEELTAHREDTRLKLLLTDLNLTDREIDVLSTVMNTDDPTRVIPLLESRGAFEEAVEEFRKENPGHQVLRFTPRLRQRLDYGFSNIRNPFIDTRMLSPGQKIRCSIRTPKKEVTFVTTIMGITEENFVIRPPVSKGRPISLGHMKNLGFRVSREQDAEYEFTSKVLGELPNETHALILSHSRSVSRMLFRNAERIPVDIEAKFFVIRQEVASEHAPAHFKSTDAQGTFNGTLKDLSIGGALVFAGEDAQNIVEGDMVVFQLSQALIREDMVAMVVGQFERDEGNRQIHLQFQALKELNRLKLTRYLTTIKDSAAGPDTPQAPSSATV
ncbi:MAG: flagellar brake protein [Deltaproteobacteria bacterium]|nr:flagellar brake protein [Deltaproteobacteria bacterium]